MEFKCDNGKTYSFPNNHCSSCKYCTDVFYDYTNGPYLFLCNIRKKYDDGCDRYEADEE